MTDNLVKINVEMKPLIPDTLKKLERGQRCSFRARDLGKLSSVQNAIYRMNNQGYKFAITEIINNGEMYTVNRQ